jgi:hypothetical protein
MKDKRGNKRERSPSPEGNLSPSDAKTPPPVPSGSPPPPRSPSEEVTSRRPCSTVFEQGGPFDGVSGKAPVVNLSSSSGEEDFIPDVSRDFEFAQWLFGDLNCDVLGPPGDDKTTILNDSDEEKEEAHEEKPTGAEDVTASAAVNPTSTAFAGAVNTPSGAKSDNSDDQGPDQKAGSDHDSGDDVGEP